MKYCAKSTLSFSKIGNEVVLLDANSGKYYGMNKTASYIWELLQKELTVEALVAELSKSFAVDLDECRKDIQSVLVKFVSKGLVEINE